MKHRKFLYLFLLSLSILGVIGCGDSQNFIASFSPAPTSVESHTSNRVTVAPDVSSAVSPRINETVASFEVIIFDSSGNEVDRRTVNRGTNAVFTEVSDGFYLIRVVGLDANLATVGYFDRSVNIDGDIVVEIPALIASNVIPSNTVPRIATGATSFLAFSELPDVITGGTEFVLIVTAYDADGTVFGEASGSVSLTGAGISFDDFGSQSFVSGRAIFSGLQYPLLTSGQVVFTAAGGGLSATTPLIAVEEGQFLEPATDLLDRFLTVFVDVAPINPQDEENAYFPSYDHKWDLDSRTGVILAIADGESDNFDSAFPLRLRLSGGGDFIRFDENGPAPTYDELTWMTPLFGIDDGLVAAAVVPQTSAFGDLPNTSHHAYLGPGVDNRLQQRLDLRNSVGTVTLTWDHAFRAGDPEDFDIPNEEYRVVVRDASGTAFATLFSNSDDFGTDRRSETADLTAFAGQVVVISFEVVNLQQSNSNSQFDELFIDDVSVTDGDNTEFVVNGDFETGDLTGWTQSVEPISQHVRTDVRTVLGLDITRTVYVDPTTKWARFLDQFTNSTASDITIDVESEINPGGGQRVFLPNPPENGVFAYNQNGDRDDVGAVFGNGVLMPDPLTNTGDQKVRFTFSVPAGETRYLCYFGFQDNVSSADDVEPPILSELVRVGREFRNDPKLVRGLTREQFDNIVNL